MRIGQGSADLPGHVFVLRLLKQRLDLLSHRRAGRRFDFDLGSLLDAVPQGCLEHG